VNTVKLRANIVSGDPDTELAQVRYKVSGAGGTIALGSGTFETEPVITPVAGMGNVVDVWYDKDDDGVRDVSCDPEIHEPKLTVVLYVISFVDSRIVTRRIAPAGPLVESTYFKLLSGEIFDSASTFRVKAVDGVHGKKSMVRVEVLYAGTSQSGPWGGIGKTDFDWAPSGVTTEAMVRFYADANNSGTYNPELGEVKIDSSEVTVCPLNTIDLTFDVSSVLAAKLPGWAGMTPAALKAFIQAKVDNSVTLARVKDSAYDYRAAIYVRVTPVGTGYFTVLPACPDPVSIPDEDKHWGDMPDDHIRFVWWLKGATGVTAPIIRGTDEILIGSDHTRTTIIHEIGHYVLGVYVMRPEFSETGCARLGEIARVGHSSQLASADEVVGGRDGTSVSRCVSPLMKE
jgi:hypothetical protein